MVFSHEKSLQDHCFQRLKAYTQPNYIDIIDISCRYMYNNAINSTLNGCVYMASLQKKTVKGIEYWSLIESKRINGKPTPIVIEYFGNTKSFAEKLMNNRNENKILKSYSHGDTYALIKIAEYLGIEKIMDDIFKPQSRNGVKRSRSLLLIALQSICDPGSKNKLESWVKTTTLQYELDLPVTSLTSRHFWEQMDDISEVELEKAEDAITRKIFRACLISSIRTNIV